MDAKAITKKIKVIALDKDTTIAELADRAGYSPAALSVKLSRGIARIDHAEKLLNVLDCELIIQDRKTHKIY